jgi:hypothetical protein
MKKIKLLVQELFGLVDEEDRLYEVKRVTNSVEWSVYEALSYQRLANIILTRHDVLVTIIRPPRQKIK